MTVAIHEPQRPDIVQQQATMQTQAVARLGAWAEAARAAYEIAQSLVKTSFVPAQFRDKPHEATAAILAGSEVGLSPMASLRSFDIIGGVAAPRALTLRAVVQSQGHDIVLQESTATRCIMAGRRRGAAEWQTSSWTIDRAKALGLTSKDNWRKQPAAMLQARATSEICRLVAADAILGIGYTVEEIDDGATGEPPSVAPTAAEPAAKRKMRRRPPPDTAEPEQPPEPEPVSDAQLAKLHAAFNEAGVTDRADRLAFASAQVQRDIGSSKELTKDEASTVIDAVEALGWIAADPEPPDPTDGDDPWASGSATQ